MKIILLLLIVIFSIIILYGINIYKQYLVEKHKTNITSDYDLLKAYDINPSNMINLPPNCKNPEQIIKHGWNQRQKYKRNKNIN